MRSRHRSRRASDELAALEEALESARPDALRHATRLLNGDVTSAEDIVQDVIGRLWERGAAAGVVYSTPYVIRSVTNAVISRWRRQRSHLAALPRMVTITGDDPTGDSVADQLQVAHLLAGLSERHRRIVALRFLHGLNGSDVAAALDLAQGTVSSTTARALGRLRLAAAAPEPLRAAV